MYVGKDPEKCAKEHKLPPLISSEITIPKKILAIRMIFYREIPDLSARLNQEYSKSTWISGTGELDLGVWAKK